MILPRGHCSRQAAASGRDRGTMVDDPAMGPLRQEVAESGRDHGTEKEASTTALQDHDLGA